MGRNIKVLLFLALSSFINCQSYEAEEKVSKAYLLIEVNKLRVKGCLCGTLEMPPVKPLKWNDQLEAISLRHAEDMAENQHLQHVGTDGSTIAWRTTDGGYKWAAVGENIAKGFESEKEVVAAWQKSRTHCKNLMKAAYTEMGVARVKNYWAQTLGKPKK